ncbi:MAG TPA: BlaI/MecI/CopY family transcriptional regulator [Vicinamibacterales bacterium]|nr:BlaI/MecI/CopY family transcriptional regulator [Vicinamibacterales bacterium]
MSWLNRIHHTSRWVGVLGPLEWRLLEALWSRGTPSSVRDLAAAFPDSAYTTLMTTLDRLHRKGLLTRDKHGRAFRYQPALGRAEFASARAGEAVRHAVQRSEGSLTPLVSYLIEAVGDRDRELLDELESLVAARRREARESRDAKSKR